MRDLRMEAIEEALYVRQCRGRPPKGRKREKRNTPKGVVFTPKTPYAKSLDARVDMIRDEIRRVGELGERAVDPWGPVAEEIISHLRDKKLHRDSYGPLAKLFDTTAKVIGHYVSCMEKQGLIIIDTKVADRKKVVFFARLP